MAAAADAAIRSISPADVPGGDYQLLLVTRTAAAAHVPPRAAPGGLRGVLAAEHQSECNPTPTLLAQRANGELTPSRQFKLENHLARCLFCRAAEVREQRASRAFSAVLATGLPSSRRTPSTTEPEAGETTEFAPVASAAADPPTTVLPVTPETVAGPSPSPMAEPAHLPPAEPAIASFPDTEQPLVPEAPAEARRGLVVYPAAGPRAGARNRNGRNGPPTGLAAAVLAYRPFLLTLAFGAVIVLVVGLALGGGSGGQSAASSLPPPAPSSTPPANVGIAATSKAQKPKPTPKPKPAATTSTAPATTTPTTPAATSTPQASANPPAAASAPAASAPAPAGSSNQPAQSSPAQTNSGSGNSSGSGPVVATQQGTGLPAQNAPTQGIGGGTPTTK